MAVSETVPQRIARLTPLSAVLAIIESRVRPVLPRRSPLAAALGGMLAEDVVTSARPPQPIALRDGFAVAAATIADANAYAPVALAAVPPRVDVGELLPREADAVIPLDAIMQRGNRAEAVATVSPGEGILAAGGDASPRAPLRRAGERLRVIDLALMTAAGIVEATVRKPRVRIACGAATRTPPVEAAISTLAHVVGTVGAMVAGPHIEAGTLDEALMDEGADAVIAVGGTGSGRQDRSVNTLARLGRVEVHGIAVSPGESAAFGWVDRRPVLLVPGRLDAAVAIWLLIARHVVARLTGGSVDDAARMLELKRKVTSTIGLAELIPVRCTDGTAEPLASGYLSFTSLARSDGWIVVPAGSEGFAAGTPVAVKPWP
jgi:molybdopterin molybdotransferase